MIKIIHAISDTGIGGAGNLLCNLLACADKRRFDIAVVLPHGSLLSPKIRDLGFRTIEIERGADRSMDLSATYSVVRILRHEQPQILHTHSAFFARLAGFFCRIPVAINTRHCADPREVMLSAPRRTVPGILERILNSHTIATADYVKGILEKRWIPSDRITVIPNGSRPLELYSIDRKNATRQALGLTPTDFVVGMVARLEPGKGHEIFLQAARRCINVCPNMRFLIVGSGSRLAELRLLTHTLDLAGQVTFTGFISDMTAIMNILDVNVNCSQYSETSSLSLSEGMSVGAVPVVSHCGGNPYMVGFGQNGRIFPIDDIDTLSDILLSLERDRAELFSLSAKSQTRFAADLTAEAMTRRVEDLYFSLLKQNEKKHRPFFRKHSIHT